VPTRIPHPTRQPAQRIGTNIRRTTGIEGCRTSIAADGLRFEPGPFVQPPQSEALRRVACGTGSLFDEIDSHGRQHCEREQIEPVVLEYRNERFDLAGADVVNVAYRNLCARYIAPPLDSHECPFQEPQRTSIVSIPETAGRVEHVEMWNVSKRH
jgi:hypothetical protein